MTAPIYQRILLKLSGEALLGNGNFGIDPVILNRIIGEIQQLLELEVQVGIVVGGGNMFRGATVAATGISRITGDHLGMIATVMNALVMRDVMHQRGMDVHVMSALPIDGIVERFDRPKAIDYLEKHGVVIFSGGTGNPLFTTDSAASLRAIEIDADILLKATNVDGVYTADPAKNPSATLFDTLTYDEVLQRQLGVMDLSAFVQCRDHHMKLRVFNINKSGALMRIVLGEHEGTLVENGGQK